MMRFRFTVIADKGLVLHTRTEFARIALHRTVRSSFTSGSALLLIAF
jgi:hypothetical protein